MITGKKLARWLSWPINLGFGLFLGACLAVEMTRSRPKKKRPPHFWRGLS